MVVNEYNNVEALANTQLSVNNMLLLYLRQECVGLKES